MRENEVKDIAAKKKIMDHELYPHICYVCVCVCVFPLSSLPMGQPVFELRTLIGSHPTAINQSGKLLVISFHQPFVLYLDHFFPFPSLRFLMPPSFPVPFSSLSSRSLFLVLTSISPSSHFRCPPFSIALPLSSSLVSWPHPPTLRPSIISSNQTLCPWPSTPPFSLLFPCDGVMRVTLLRLLLPFLFTNFTSTYPSNPFKLFHSICPWLAL